MRPEVPNVPVTRVTVLAYLACFAVAFVLPNLAARRFLLHPGPDSLVARVDTFRRHARDYDLVFVGDSRTYCDIAPAQIDRELGTHSINVATWANWFFSQYAALEDILPSLRPDAVVVWSIGHQNFDLRADPLNYPIGVANVPRYIGWGYSVSKVMDNVVGMLPGLDVYAYRHALRARVDATLKQEVLVWPARPSTTVPVRYAEEAEQVRRRYASNPHVVSIEVLHDEGGITSVGLHWDRGNYERIELDHDYFRRKQHELLTELKPLRGTVYEPDPARWNNFLAVLDLCQKHHVRLIVNEVEEAPYNYSNPNDRRLLREFMTKVRAEVERRGIPYVRADWEQLSDADYFDWNHLNSDGIAKYTQLLAPLLRSELRR